MSRIPTEVPPLGPDGKLAPYFLSVTPGDSGFPYVVRDDRSNSIAAFRHKGHAMAFAEKHNAFVRRVFDAPFTDPNHYDDLPRGVWLP